MFSNATACSERWSRVSALGDVRVSPLIGKRGERLTGKRGDAEGLRRTRSAKTAKSSRERTSENDSKIFCLQVSGGVVSVPPQSANGLRLYERSNMSPEFRRARD